MLNESIELTKETLKKRSSHYRNLVIAVSLLLFISPITALVTLSWQPLLAWLFIPFFYVVFLYSDQCKLSHWQLTILSYWQDDKLNLNFLEQSLLHLPVFPENTIKSMLALLPISKEAESLSFDIRRKLVFVQKKINKSHSLRNILIIFSIIIIISSILLSIGLSSFLPLMFITLTILLRFIEYWYFKLQVIQLQQEIIPYQSEKSIKSTFLHINYYPLKLRL